MNTLLRTALLGGLLASVTQPVHADAWKHELAPYLMGAGLSGETGVGDAVIDVDASFGDILDNLKFGFMGAYRGSKGPYSVMVDTIYVKLEASSKGPAGLLSAKAEIQQAVVEADLGYALNERLELLAGLRYVGLQAKVQVTGPQDQRLAGSTDESWIDPVIGVRYTWPLGDQWSAALRGDVGGFGVGSDLAWQAMATLRWQTSSRVGWLLAYRHLDMDYESGSGNRAFQYDMAMSGPALGVVISF
jgi:opacity protein-like surface antigen